jgi:hypothetical protein
LSLLESWGSISGVIGREHGEALCAALNDEERVTLSTLLQNIAGEQGLTPRVHPWLSTVET